MAIIPRVNPESVSRIDGLPSVRNTTQVSSAPAEAMGRAVQGLGELAGKIYEQKVEENNVAALMDARRQYDEWENQQFDPENQNGIERYQGRDALQAERDMIPASRTQLDNIGASLPPGARQRWAQVAYQAESAFGDRVRRTAYQRHEQWQQFTRQSAQQAMANSAAMAIGTGDEATFVPKLDEATAVFEQNLRLQLGQGADVSEASRQFRSGIIRSGIEQALARQDVPTAQALLDRYRDRMNVQDVTELNRTIVPYNQADQAAEAWSDILAGGEGTPAGVAVNLDPNMSPEERSAADRAIRADVMNNPPANGRALPGEHLARGQQFYGAVEGILKPFGARVTSTTGDEHNAGSLHPSGAAMDIGVKEFDPAKQEEMLNALRADPRLYVIDERTRPAGQAVWSAPHFHVEIRGARANRGGSVDGPRQPNGPPPANMTEAIARIRARFPTDRRMQDRVIGQAQRYFQEQDQAKQDQMEAITLAINRSAPGADLQTFLTVGQQQMVRDSGNWDAWQNNQRERVIAGLVHDDPHYVADVNEARMRDPVAWARNFDPNSIENQRLLSQASREMFGQMRDKIRNAQTQNSAIADYASQDEAMTFNIFRPLGITDEGVRDAGVKSRNALARGAIQSRWYMVKQDWAITHPGQTMTAEQRDKIMIDLAAEFAINGMRDPGTRDGAVEAGTAFGVSVPEAARRRIIALGMQQGRLYTDADVRRIYASGNRDGASQ